MLKNIVIVLLVLSLLAACGALALVGGFWYYHTMSTPTQPPTAMPPTGTPTPECETSTPDPTPISWVGDDFGDEGAFPAKVDGPAIAELWNPTNNFCALIKINADEVLEWGYSGAWWPAGSQDALEARWPHHRTEYSAKPSNGECRIFSSVQDLEEVYP